MTDLWELGSVLAGHMAWHFGVALVLSTGIYLYFKSWKLALLCFAASFYTDVDHLYEYTMAHGWSLDLKSILSGEYFVEVGKRYLWLHSYETLIVVWLLAWSFKKFPAAVAFSLGFISHLVIDQSAYPLEPFAYSLIYRWLNGFQPEAFGEL